MSVVLGVVMIAYQRQRKKILEWQARPMFHQILHQLMKQVLYSTTVEFITSPLGHTIHIHGLRMDLPRLDYYHNIYKIIV